MRSHEIILEDLKMLSSDSAVEKHFSCLDFINIQKTEIDQRNVGVSGCCVFLRSFAFIGKIDSGSQAVIITLSNIKLVLPSCSAPSTPLILDLSGWS